MTSAGTYTYEIDLAGMLGAVTRARGRQKVVQRFLSVDPLARIAPGWSLYRFAFNNPIYYNDPRGLFETKFAARIYKFFKGGDEIGYDPNKEEYFVGTASNTDDAAVYKRVFRGNDSNPGGGILNAFDKYPTGLGYAGVKLVEQGENVENVGDAIAGAGILMTPYVPVVGPEVTAFGSGVALYGVGLQMVDIYISDEPNKLREMIKKAVVEGLPIGVAGAAVEKINKLPIGDLDKTILKSLIEGGGYLLEKTSEKGINAIIDQIFDKAENNSVRPTPPINNDNSIIIQH